MLEVQAPIRLTLRGPFITKSAAPRGYGIDAAPARERAGNERLVIPGTHILGKLRQAWEELAGVLEDEGRAFPLGAVDDWLGRAADHGDWAPEAKRLTLSDFVLDGPEPPPQLRYRIRIDRDRLSVQKGAYQVIESPFAPGARPDFIGTAHFLAGDRTEADDVLRWIELGLKWVDQLGAQRTIGFGRLLDAEVGRTQPVALTQRGAPALQPARVLQMEVRPLAPFCFAQRRRSRNLFESHAFVPGSAIKGAIIRRLKQMTAAYPSLHEHRDAIGVTHAFPSATGRRPVVPPLSLVKTKTSGGFVDAALAAGPFLLGGEAPEFAVDWKDRSGIAAAFGWPEPTRELRVRTEMDPKDQRAADERLFAYELIVPGDCRWYASIRLPDLAGARLAALCAELEDLLSHPVDGLGKTKVRAEVRLQPAAPANQPLIPIRDRWLVTLQTPALLCDPERIAGEKATAANLWAAYAAAWADLSGGRVCLADYFASQSLTGGTYLYKRFQQPAPYRPYLLTDAGSLFVLRAADGNAADLTDLMEAWLRDGLPMPGWARKGFARDGLPGDHWKNCPYIRENGYGEIAVNLPVHADPAHQPPGETLPWLDAPSPTEEQADVA